MSENDESREKRVAKIQVMLAESELAEIDDWRFNTRSSSRANAIRKLIFLGMAFWDNDRNAAEKELDDSNVD